MKLSRILPLLLVVLMIGLVTACGSEDTGSAGDAMDKAGDAVDDAMDKAGDAVDTAMDKTGDAVDTAVDKTGDAVDTAMADGAGMAEKIKAELAEKESDLEKITDEMKNLSPADMAGAKANELKAKSEALGGEIAKLKEKLASLVE